MPSPLRHRALLALLLTLTLGCARPPLQPRDPAPGSPTLKVLSYNVNYGIAGDQQTIAVIKAQGADVILLQETNARWEVALRSALSEDYPHMSFEHCCGAGGLAALSKRPMRAPERIEPPSPGWFPAMRVIVESALGEVQVLNVHLRPPFSDSGSVISGYVTTPPVREAEISAYLKHMSDALPTLIVGDFNENISGRAVEQVRARGMESAVEQFALGQSTWRGWGIMKPLKLQLDHIFYNPTHLAPLRAEVIEAGRSDHLPLLATFERKR